MKLDVDLSALHCAVAPLGEAKTELTEINGKYITIEHLCEIKVDINREQELLTPNEHVDSIDYEVAYYEMRNVAAFIINVIAGEISDGLIIIDEDYSMSAQKRAKIKQVLRISHSLADRCIPTNFKAHDSTLSILLTCMKAVSCEDVANVKHFGDFHDSRL